MRKKIIQAVKVMAKTNKVRVVIREEEQSLLVLLDQGDPGDLGVIEDQKVVGGPGKVKVAIGVGVATEARVATGAAIHGRLVSIKTEWKKYIRSIRFSGSE